MRSTNCGNVPADWRASIGPIGKPWHRITAGRRPGVLPAGTVRWHASVNAPDRNVPFTPSRSCPIHDRGVRWMRRDPRRRQVIAAVARLGERVGGEADAHAEVDELLDDGRVLPLVEVIHQLGALVTDESVMLEPHGPFHGLVR